MSLSGLRVDQKCMDVYNEMKNRAMHKWATYKVVNAKDIVLDETTDPNPTKNRDDDRSAFAELTSQLMLIAEPRYIVYDFGFANKKGKVINMVAFIFWMPDMPSLQCKIKDKMLYASGKDTIKKQLTGLKIDFHANDFDELYYDVLADEIEKKAKA